MQHDRDERHTVARQTLHRIANHVLARGQQASTGQVGLRVTPGGFGTTEIRSDRERLRVAGAALVRESAAPTGSWVRSIAIAGATLRELAEFADVDLAPDLWTGNDMPALGDVDEPLVLDSDAACRIADWYDIIARALDRLVLETSADDPASLAQLWPEHFDVALDMAFDRAEPTTRRVNVGGSPGDGFDVAPYLYVGPWTPDRPGDPEYWNAPFGATLAAHSVTSGPDPVGAASAFFRSGLERLAR
jgi:hypothetical protein